MTKSTGFYKRQNRGQSQVSQESDSDPCFHPLEYHQHVYGRLSAATYGLVPGAAEYGEAVVSTLNGMKLEAVTSGSQANKWLMKG